MFKIKKDLKHQLEENIVIHKDIFNMSEDIIVKIFNTTGMTKISNLLMSQKVEKPEKLPENKLYRNII